MHKLLIRDSLCVAAILLLASCGGGGSSDSDVPAVTADSQTVIDTPAEDAPLETSTETVPASPVESDCSVSGINQWVDDSMRDYYIYYDQVPVLDLASFETPEELVKQLRVDPDRFSYVNDQSTNDQYYEEGISAGFGFWISYLNDIAHFRKIIGGSPADVAGIKRGDVLISVNGIPERDIDDDLWSELFSDTHEHQTMTVQTGDDPPRDVTIAYSEYRINTVPEASFYTTDNGAKIGYFLISNFLIPTTDAINTVLAWLVDNQVDDLILDLRYNGGGRSNVARTLASQIVGESFTGEPFQIRHNNDKYSEEDYTRYFESEPYSLNLSRLIVLTTEKTASASESIINGLQPYIDVVVIGDTTSGKPFTSRSNDNCGKSLHAMHAIRTNSVGVSVANGITPDCYVADEYLFETDDARDSLTSAGLDYIINATCQTSPPAAKADSHSAFHRHNRTATPEAIMERPADIID
ncbi:MAG: S41 family peptidase [Granulosicoccus sp.]